MKKIAWIKFWTRSFGLFRYYVYIDSNRLPFWKKYFGSIWRHALTIPDGKLVAYYHDRTELKRMTRRIYQASCPGFATFNHFTRQIIGWMKGFILFNQKLDESKLTALDDEELLRVFKQWYGKYLHWQIGVYFYFVLEPIVTEVFNKKLESHLRKKKLIGKVADYQAVVMSPEKMNAVALEQKMALESALLVKQNPRKKQVIVERFYNQFLWIPCYDIRDQEYDISYFSKRVEELLSYSSEDLKSQLNNLTADFRARRQAFSRLLPTLKGDRVLIELAKIMHWLVYYKDYRDDLRRQAGYAGKRFMNILARRFGLTLNEVNYLTPPEVESWLKGWAVPTTEVNRRQNGYVFLANANGISLFCGEEAERMVQRELSQAGGDAGVIKGIVGSKGKASGPVKIVRHSVSISKVNVGDILVAVTTHPEYVPAMKRCKAIVTDEGGITSHAAIVARELGIPCIIGTGNATRVLTDGDLIEVDADDGFVKKIVK